MKTDYLITEISKPKNAIGSAARQMHVPGDDAVLDYLNTDIDNEPQKKGRVLVTSSARQQSEIRDIIKNYKAADVMSKDSITGLQLPPNRKRYSDRSSRVQTPNLQKSGRSR